MGLRGPMGKGFPLSEFKGSGLLMIGGGVNLPILRIVLLCGFENRQGSTCIFLLYGAPTPAGRLYKDDLDRWQQSEELCCIQAADIRDNRWPYQAGAVSELIKQCQFDPRPPQR